MIIIMLPSLKLAICCQSHLPRNKVIIVNFLTYLPNIYPGFQIRKPFIKIVSLQQLPSRRTYQTVPHVIPGRKTKSRQNYLQKALRCLFWMPCPTIQNDFCCFEKSQVSIFRFSKFIKDSQPPPGNRCGIWKHFFKTFSQDVESKPDSDVWKFKNKSVHTMLHITVYCIYYTVKSILY